jgi:hypothetical protein
MREWRGIWFGSSCDGEAEVGLWRMGTWAWVRCGEGEVGIRRRAVVFPFGGVENWAGGMVRRHDVCVEEMDSLGRKRCSEWDVFGGSNEMACFVCMFVRVCRLLKNDRQEKCL